MVSVHALCFCFSIDIDPFVTRLRLHTSLSPVYIHFQPILTKDYPLYHFNAEFHTVRGNEEKMIPQILGNPAPLSHLIAYLLRRVEL
jgi:hypothetical protein